MLEGLKTQDRLCFVGCMNKCLLPLAKPEN
jgi:hypothetical protein